MHHQLGAFTSISWFWPALVIIAILFIIGLIIFKAGRHEEESNLTDEEEMAEIYFPDLVSEVTQLRAEVKKLKGKSVR